MIAEISNSDDLKSTLMSALNAMLLIISNAKHPSNLVLELSGSSSEEIGTSLAVKTVQNLKSILYY